MTPDDETEGYIPEAAGLGDGEVLIFDQAEFEQDFNCYAAMVKDGGLFVLCKESRKWVLAEGRGLGATKPTGRLTRVQ